MKNNKEELRAHAILFLIFCSLSPYTYAAHNKKWFHVQFHHFKTDEEMYTDFLAKLEQLKSTEQKYDLNNIEKALKKETDGKK